MTRLARPGPYVVNTHPVANRDGLRSALSTRTFRMQACQVSLDTTSRGDLVDGGGTVENLNNLIPAGSGYQIQVAAGINGNGPIVANDTATGQTHAPVLTPN